MDLGLKGKVALVTGGSRGIGRATALALAGEGSDIAVLARDPQRLQSVRQELAALGVRVHAVSADTTASREVDRAIAEVVTVMGGLDIVVNAAATPATEQTAPHLAGLDDAAVLEDVNTKAIGYLRVARAAAPHLVASGGGRIVNVSGMNTRLTGSVAGTMRNVAVVALTKNLADELGPRGVTVNAVHPGYTVTERTPEQLEEWALREGVSPDRIRATLAETTSSQRLVTADEVADVIVFLASSRAVSINGEAIPIDGGRRGHIWY